MKKLGFSVFLFLFPGLLRFRVVCVSVLCAVRRYVGGFVKGRRGGGSYF